MPFSIHITDLFILLKLWRNKSAALKNTLPQKIKFIGLHNCLFPRLYTEDCTNWVMNKPQPLYLPAGCQQCGKLRLQKVLLDLGALLLA